MDTSSHTLLQDQNEKQQTGISFQSKLLTFLTSIAIVGLVVCVVLFSRSGATSGNIHVEDHDDYVDPFPLETLEDPEFATSTHDRDFGDDAGVVAKPSCEHLWWKMGKTKHDKLEVFKHTSTEVTLRDVYCIPLEFVRFTQDTVDNSTTGGKSLQYWINLFATTGYFKKKHQPDMVHWRSNWYQSIDNRRVYCARKANLTWIPAHVHEFDDELPVSQKTRFPLNISSPYFTGKKYARTWGEAAVYRSICERTPDFLAFGSTNLPQVVHYNHTNHTNTTGPAHLPRAMSTPHPAVRSVHARIVKE
eukprot:gnl/Spiro4/27336_TR13610_c0_g1_i1.p1 gnl/Spiro4/27336_TR13610_c0_g1~~gnl/Spiro4/27336_TR13610_c0_g1_i1.p1  ORF type:complete len:320 (-),score=73.96 gnl/Spiro4/27336_TR13610_c0_g1_i1:35-946(-)